MTVLILLLVIMAVFWGVSLLRLGVRVHYGADGLSVMVLAGPANIKILPAGEKKRRKDKPKKKKTKRAGQPQPKGVGQPGTLSRLLDLLPTLLEAAGSLRRKIRIDHLDMTLIWGGSDPASIAIGYGQANAAFGMIWPLFENNFRVKRHQLHIDMDYGRSSPAVEVTAAITVTIGQIFALGGWYGLKVLILWIGSGRPAAKQQEV